MEFYCQKCDVKFAHTGIKKEYHDPVFGPCAKYMAPCTKCREEVDEFRRPKQSSTYKPESMAPCGYTGRCRHCS